MDNKPMLSVILTVYNMEECLEACLASLAAQTLPTEVWELICIDDGSADQSIEILEQWKTRLPNMSVAKVDNLGAGGARNIGMEAACGEYLMLLDSDDLFEPTLLEEMLTQAKAQRADIVVCKSNEFHHKTHIWHHTGWAVRTKNLPKETVFSGASVGDELFRAFAGWPWDKLYRTAFLRENHLAFPVLRNSEDLCFVYPALAKAKRISVIEEELIHHRTCRSGSVSTSQIRDPWDFYHAIEIAKTELQKGSNWETFHQGYANWALDYAFWNIESVPAGDCRKDLVSALFDGRMPALELELHSLEYFSLYPTNASYYRQFKQEAEGKGVTSRRSKANIVSTAANYFATMDIPSTVKNWKKIKGASS